MDFKLPGTAYGEVEKIVRAIGKLKKKASNDDIAGASGLNATTVSRNSKFLVASGLVEKGRAKQLTEVGQAVYLAVESNLEDRLHRAWGRVIDGCDYLSKQQVLLEMKSPIDEAEFVSRLIANSGEAPSKYNKAGAGAVVEIFVRSGRAERVDGKVRFVPPAEPESQSAPKASPASSPKPAPSRAVTPGDEAVPPQKAVSSAPVQAPHLGMPEPSVHIDIQVHISADSSPEQIDQIFKSMAKHLYGRE